MRISRESVFDPVFVQQEKVICVVCYLCNVYISEINKDVAVNANVDKGWSGSFC